MLTRHPAVEVVAPSDYTLVMSRIALISKNAPHPAAARLFLDFLLSTRGQQHIAAASMNPVRSDLPANGSFDLKIIPTRAIRVGPALLVNLDKLSRQQFYRKWHEVLEVASNEDSLLQATR